ncbi:response regulator [Candidatus Woesearchaeota archaeon]|nr:response regulator [Candidatus Woesearchaeota archaeon]
MERSAEDSDHTLDSRCSGVLVIDDEKSVAEVLSIMAEENGYDVARADDYDSGLKAAAEAPDRLVVCDFNLGQYKGTDLLRKAKEKNPDLRAVILSGKAKDPDVKQELEQAVEEGVIFEFGAKPICMKDYLSMLDRYVEPA